ncbi:MAG TPA: hemolysin family protein [Vicinamibacterales bacterium]|nr:hemolysin family protein [Vicinamibacterales bacterium]
MILPGLLALLAAAAVYLGAVSAAFALLMRLSLRLLAERGSRSSRLGAYLDDPVQLFLPVRAMLGGIHIAVALLLATVCWRGGAAGLAWIFLGSLTFILVFEHLLPYLIVRRDPERALEALIPSFDAAARALWPIVAPLRAAAAWRQTRPAAADPAASDEDQQQATAAYLDAGEQEGLIERDERQLLQSVVDFGDTLVREVMTPRPDIVAVRAETTLAELRAFFREHEYSRIPVYVDSLDHIVGFVFIKDLIRLPEDEPPDKAVPALVRPAYVVPETKRVSDLLREFQRQQWQIAIVVDEYGGTAGLVTLEDLIEEIVGEIRDEYDVETEAIVDEGGGRFVVSGKADIDAVADRLGVVIEREGFDTFGGYLMARLGRVPATGESLLVDGLAVEVIHAERRRVHRLRVARAERAAAAGATAPEAGSP